MGKGNRTLKKSVEESQSKADKIRLLSLQYAQRKVTAADCSDVREMSVTPKHCEAQKRQRELRKKATFPEKAFHELLIDLGVPFRFQPICHVSDEQYFILDFVVNRDPKRIFEIDGSSHDGRESYDEWRTVKILKTRQYRGYQVQRFTNAQVLSGEVRKQLFALYGAPSKKKKRRAAKHGGDAYDAMSAGAFAFLAEKKRTA